MSLGLDKLHNLTTGAPTPYEVRVDLQTANESAYAVYDFFQVASSRERYRLAVGKYRGTAGKGRGRHPRAPRSARSAHIEAPGGTATGGRGSVGGTLFLAGRRMALLPAGAWGVNEVVTAVLNHRKVTISVRETSTHTPPPASIKTLLLCSPK